VSFPDAALLAGGLATRLGSLAQDTPKALLEVGGRPFIDWQLEQVAAQGVQRVVLCLGHLAQAIEGHVGDGSRYGLQVRYSYDGPKALGTGGALRQALPLLSDPFYVLYADSWLQAPWAAMHQAYSLGDCDAVMSVLRNRGQWDSSNVQFEGGWVKAYSKKSPGPDFDCIDYGLNLFSAGSLGLLSKDVFDLGELQGLLAARGRLRGVEATERFYEIGTPEGLAQTRAFLTRRSA
jgi:MurNAc alpha-1-phosphate uridylyltransferase